MSAAILDPLGIYLAACPQLAGGEMHVDEVSFGVPYVLYMRPELEVVRRYADKSTMCQYMFGVRSSQSYPVETLQVMKNSELQRRVNVWMQEQRATGNLPALPAGLTPRRVEVLQTECPLEDGLTTGKFELLCRIIYLKKGEE